MLKRHHPNLFRVQQTISRMQCPRLNDMAAEPAKR
mgnify:CR=1 FL=1